VDFSRTVQKRKPVKYPIPTTSIRSGTKGGPGKECIRMSSTIERKHRDVLTYGVSKKKKLLGKGRNRE